MLLAGCSREESTTVTAPPPADKPAAVASVSTAELVNTMIQKMGGQEALESIDSIVLKGDGTRTRIGQIPRTGGEDMTITLKDVTETIDLANGRAAFDNDIVLGEGAFTMHRTEALTSYKGKPVAWGTTSGGRPKIATSVNGIFSWATQNSPDILLRRNIITVALEASKSANANEPAEERPFNGRTSYYGTARIGDEDVELFFNIESGLLDGFITLDTETMLGDVEAHYILSDYRAVGDVVLPHSLTILKDGAPYASITYSSISINDPVALEIFTLPDDVIAQAEQVIASDGSWAPLTLTPVADKVYHAEAFSHNSMVVEFPSFVAVIEGAYTEAQSLTLARMVEEKFGKPIRYVIPSHPHYDHTGGIRGLAAVGATVLVSAGHEAELRGIVEAPHTNPPDELARRANAGQQVGGVEVFTEKKVITEGDQVLELYEVHSIPHVDPKTLAYVPGAGALFQSDLFFGAPGPDAEALLAAIRSLNLEVKSIVGGHGGTLPFDNLVAAVEKN